MGDNLLGAAASSAGNNLISNTRKDGDNPAAIKLFLNLLLILILVGSEGIKVIFRNNFGKHGINLFRLVLCACCFAGIAYLASNNFHWNLSQAIIGRTNYNNQFAHTYSPIKNQNNITFACHSISIIYALLAAFIFIKGIISYIKASKEKPDSNYKGDSYLLGFLEDYGYSQERIQFLVEPLYVIFIGALLSLYLPKSGIPLIFCGFSIWVNILVDKMFGNPSADSMKSEMQSKHEQEIISHEVTG